MQTLCQRNEENICTQCGHFREPGKFVSCPAKLPAKLARPARKKPIDHTDCIHLDLSTELGATLAATGCGGCGQWSSLCSCDLYGAVAPFCTPRDKHARACRKCVDYVSRSISPLSDISPLPN